VSLLGARNPRDYSFVELGAETDGGVLAGVAHPFGATRTIQLGEPIAIEGRCVVFSNELFDAQPCVRTVFRDGRWRELGVRLEGDRLVEVELPSELNWPGSEGYHFDQPIAAAALAEAIAKQPWTGLFVAVDYGKTLEELSQHTPAGTARAYFRHTQSNDLLARPGEQDLTCHVCWNWIESALRLKGFAAPMVESQEAFFIRHAGAFIAATSAAEAARFSQRKLALMQLLHPAHLGQKFQVLHALRD
jgi:SAM-dependent MidA family methyltransferase